MIEVSDIHKRFDDVWAVRGVSFQVPGGAFLVLLGPSGCGKSTMLRMLAGLEMPTGGTIAFDGKVVSDGDRGWMTDPALRNVGLVFQSYALWPHKTVAGNVEWPLKVANWAKAERKARVEEVLNLLAIGNLADRYPNEISGGQQQRVAIARMIGPRPGILLFDEPLSNLDAKLRVEMRTELLRVHRATGATSVYVTHDQVEAMTMASHVAVMDNGRVEQFGPPDMLVSQPATAFVASFVGTPPGNLLRLDEPADERLAGLLPAADGGPALAMYRAEDIAVSAEPTEYAVALEFAEMSPIAGRAMITGVNGDLRLTAVVDRPPPLRPGERIFFQLPEKPAAVFGADGARIA